VTGTFSDKKSVISRGLSCYKKKISPFTNAENAPPFGFSAKDLGNTVTGAGD
jgi:hypothetical protein